MKNMKSDEFKEKIFIIIDRWSFETCIFCDNRSLISLDGLKEPVCENCKKKMTDGTYLGEIAKLVYD